MNLLISVLGSWMFSKVCSRHLLLHLCSQNAHPQHIRLYENYITAKNQRLHQTQQGRVWFLPWSQTVSSKNPLVSITYSWTSSPSANFTHWEETARLASPLRKASLLHSSQPERWIMRSSIFPITLSQLSSFTRPSVCWPSVEKRNILLHHSVGTSKKGIFCAMMSLLVHL